jgi:membrane protein involved in colicin uptake
MNNKTVFVRTEKGEAEANGQTSLLFGEAKRVFMLVNNKSTVDDMRKHAAPSLRPDLEGILAQLESDDFIRDKDGSAAKKAVPSGVMAKLATPPKMATPVKPAAPAPAAEEEDALDFTSGLHPPVQDTGAATASAGPSVPAKPAAPSVEDLDFSSLVSPAAPGAAKPTPAAPAAPPPKVGPAEIDFSTLVSPAAPGAAKPAPQPVPETKKPGPAEIDFSSILSGGGVDKAEQAAQEKARAEAEAKARMRAELEAKVRAETEAKARAAAEARMRAEAEAKARAETRVREEAEARARAEAESKARMRAELEAKMRAEAEAKARAEAEARARAEAEARARAEAEARAQAERQARAQAEREARVRAEVEAKARAEAEARARAEAEARARAETEAKMRADLEAKIRAEAEARARAEAEAKMRAEAEAKARAEREKQASSFSELDFSSILQMPTEEPAPDIARIEAEARLRAEAEARGKAEAEARVKSQAEAKVKAEADARAKLRAELEAGIRNVQVADATVTSGRNQARSMIATVLFFDVVGYTRQSVARQIELKAQFNSLISGLIGHVDEEHRIILDTGDGAAIGFLQHPEDALDVAMKFRAAVTANNHRNYPDLKVRAGIHLGPVNVMKDMNDQLNMVGDGINDAQRIMSFAGVDQIYVSRAYFDVISRLTADSARLFKYYGTQKDKHGREHQVYQVLGDGAGVSTQGAMPPSGGVESLLQDLSMMLQEPERAPAPEPSRPAPQPSGEWQPMEIPGAQARPAQQQELEAKRSAELAAEQARARAQQEAARAKAEEEAARARAEEEAAMQQQEEAARKLAAEQAKAFAEAEKRARKMADAEEKARQREAKVREKEAKKQAKRDAAAAGRRKAARPVRVSHGFPLFKVLFMLIVLAVGAVVGLPNIWPMQEYIPLVEGELSSQLKQPVHIGGMSVATVPAPRIDLRGVTIGSAQQLKIGHVALFFDPLSLPANVKKLEKVDLEGVAVDADSFSAVLPWLLAAGASDKYPVEHLELHDAHITGGAAIPAFGGKIKFDSYGRYTKATLSSTDGKYQVVLEPKEKGRAQVDVSVSDGSLPMVPAIEFSSLELTGELADGVANFTSVSGALYGGSLKGTAALTWQNGWQLQGNVAVQSILMEKAIPGLRMTGEMEGNASFIMNGTGLAQLVGAPHLQGTFGVKDGDVKGIDIVETLRTDTRQLVAGTTHFEVLTGSLRLDSSGEHLKPIKVSAGAMTISGSVDAAPDGGLSGQLSVDTSKVRAGLGSLPLRLGGTVSAPAWSTGR